jgi:hypothetical protein
MPQESQFDYAKLPDGSYAKFPKGTPPEAMRSRLEKEGLLKPKVEAAPVKQNPMYDRVLYNIGQGVESMMDTPNRMGKRSRELFKEANTPGAKAMAPLRAENEEVANLLKGMFQSTAPGMLGQPADKNISNALTTFFGGEEGLERPSVRGTVEAATKPRAVLSEVMRTAKAEGGPKPLPNPTEAGSIIGAMTRGKQFLDVVDAAAKDIPVNWKPAYEWAQKALELGKKGFTVPKPITDFVAWVDSRMKPGMDPSGIPNTTIDRGAEEHPLLYKDSRNFETSLGAKIPWDQDVGGKMDGIMKKMRESLGEETAKSLKPIGLDTHYLRGKAEIAKAVRARERSYGIGKIGGKLAGYGAGTVVGHPLLLGYGGGLAGQDLAGSMVRSVTEAGGTK